MSKFMRSILATCTILFSLLANAATTPAAPEPLQLYQAPEANAKVIGAIKPGSTLIPIFQKNGWIEIGNPQDGMVGWVKQSDMQKAGYPTLFIRTFSQTPGQSGYKIIQYSGSEKMDQGKIDELMKNVQRQQVDFQKAMDQLKEQSYQNLQRLNEQFKQFWDNNSKQLKQFVAPVLQPAVVVPEKKQEKNKTTTDSSKTK